MYPGTPAFLYAAQGASMAGHMRDELTKVCSSFSNSIRSDPISNLGASFSLMYRLARPIGIGNNHSITIQYV